MEKISKVAITMIFLGGLAIMVKNNKKNYDIPSFLKKTAADVEVPYDATDVRVGGVKAIDISGRDDRNSSDIEEDCSEVIRSNDISNEVAVGNVGCGRVRMSPMEKESFTSIVKAWNNEQIELALDIIPVEMVYNRIGRELKHARELQKSISDLATLAK